jgi:competence protein ComEA
VSSPGDDPANEARSLLSEDPVFGWTAGDRRAVFAFGIALVALSAWHLAQASRRGGLVEIDRLPASTSAYRLNMNRATWVEWAQLDGIGETLGRAIIADREQNGPFASVEELTRVPGIGPKKLAAIRPWLVLGDELPPGSDPRSR